ncbi:MAG: Gmad2 immunoglobulin-like domain-containing protein, partial [Candidatus Levybacteria bacterium]|nr:Gmad2 immunoglobulin-like domain-containing protein [Candidatus Levybacteria bacterium]
MKKLGMRIFVTILVIIGVFGAFYFFKQQQKIEGISSFEECADAGFPIMESYPSQCRTSNGKNFTQEIGNELSLVDEISIVFPRPNQIIFSPLQVSGKARGAWYFEGSFSGELFDDNKKLIGTVVLQALGEWMSEDFVPFVGELKFETPNTSKGKLILKNAN